MHAGEDQIIECTSSCNTTSLYDYVPSMYDFYVLELVGDNWIYNDCGILRVKYMNSYVSEWTTWCWLLRPPWHRLCS